MNSPKTALNCTSLPQRSFLWSLGWKFKSSDPGFAVAWMLYANYGWSKSKWSNGLKISWKADLGQRLGFGLHSDWISVRFKIQYSFPFVFPQAEAFNPCCVFLDSFMSFWLHKIPTEVIPGFDGDSISPVSVRRGW